MGNPPLVSILIPNYNKAPYLRETLDSVLAQTYSNWECIVVDDHSTDDSWMILVEYGQRDSRFKIVRRSDNLPKGGNVCRNYAFRLSKGEFVQWFDSDDVLEPTAIFNRINLLGSRSELNFVVFSGRKFYKVVSDSDIVFSPIPFGNNILCSFIALDPPWLIQGCLIKRKFLVDKNILWNESVTIIQDIFFSLDLIFSSENFLLDTGIPDWNWRWHEDGNNTGAGRGNRKNLNSLSEFINFSYSFIKDCPNGCVFYRIGCFDIIYSSRKAFGISWFKQIYMPISKNLNFSFYENLFFLVLFSFNLLFTIFPNTVELRFQNKLMFFLKRSIRKDDSYSRKFNRVTLSDLFLKTP